ncbi:hypothetical protein QH_0045 [Vibrio phage QH]|uniref:hypothetical protein n=1 Tax=Vibrio phage QH TaxID=1558469 RepID=UPI00003CEC44|nr:hypothetical protein ACQ41_gp45 [Vibrio phage QH]YP_053003.1 hypothetical protein VP2p44 [Vibrio phage VP2]YP_053041.1 hypothetical protein VP5_gp47 [Vibrio phage VP5]AIZ01396.1 hypothetical protein QH_0045 [Vibrio phage QH]AIZ01685.1 hypothetical protein J3_0046 [Vibrio phage J3]
MKKYEPNYKVSIIAGDKGRFYVVRLKDSNGGYEGGTFIISRMVGTRNYTRFYKVTPDSKSKVSYPLFPTLRDAIMAVVA